jgi:hypothetical protein
MNAPSLAWPSIDEALTDHQELKSGVGISLQREPAWTNQPPQALLPHDPRAFDRPPRRPDHEAVLRAVREEALGSGLARRLF